MWDHGLRFLWTDAAIEKLEEIFEYYKVKASIEVGSKVVGSIVDSTIKLETHPRIGQVEDLLNDRENEYRYVVAGNYKVIYWIEEPLSENCNCV
jgi:toxin ParE1/3/4